MAESELTDIEVLVLCAIYRKVGFAIVKKPANITLEGIYAQLKGLGISKRDVKDAIKSPIRIQPARPYQKRKTYTLTRKGALLASQICARSWDEISDRLKHD